MHKLLLLLALLFVVPAVHAGIVNGDFELGPSGWIEESTHVPVGSLICTVPNCDNAGGAAGPHSGDWWTFFGATTPDVVPEDASITQTVTFPTGESQVSFWLWIGNRV